MVWSPPTLSVIVLGGALLALIVGVTAYREHPNPMALPVTLLMLATAGWAIPAAIGYAASTTELALLAEKARYPGTVMTPLAFYLVAFRYVGWTSWIRLRILGVISVIPAVTIALVLTNDLHGLFWHQVEMQSVVGGTVLLTEPGPWFPIHIGWSYTVMVASLAVLVREMWQIDPFNRKQAAAILLGGLIPLAYNVLFIVGHSPGGDVDLTPVALAVSGAIFAIALFRLDLIQLGPIARRRVLSEIPDGVIVVDSSGQIRDFNAIASNIVAELAVGEVTDDILPQEMQGKEGEFTVPVDDEPKRFRYARKPFHDRHGQVFGELLYLRDISAIARREQRISVLNRVLRHNIRNELTIQLGHLELLREQSTASMDTHLETIEGSIRRIQRFADQARLVDRTLRDPGRVEPVALSSAIDRAVASVASEHDSAQIDTAVPEETLTVRTIDRELLEWVIAELLENAIVHGGASSNQVTIRVQSADPMATIQVLDDGPGIPQAERNAVQSSVETALEHGSGVGLWLARWTAERSGGTLTFGERNGRHAVSMSLPLQNDDSTTA